MRYDTPVKWTSDTEGLVKVKQFRCEKFRHCRTDDGKIVWVDKTQTLKVLWGGIMQIDKIQILTDWWGSYNRDRQDSATEGLVNVHDVCLMLSADLECYNVSIPTWSTENSQPVSLPAAPPLLLKPQWFPSLISAYIPSSEWFAA